jgi:hypothetical protein
MMMYYLMNETAWQEQSQIVRECYEGNIKKGSFRETELAMNKTIHAMEYWIN